MGHTTSLGRNRKDDPTVSEYRSAQERMLDRHGVEAESRFVDVPLLAGRAHVLVAGDGPPVMMVIGGGMVAAMWAPLMAELDGFTLYAVDLPGHGLSDPTTYRTTTLRSTAVGFLEQLLDGLGLDEPALIGNSMGGTWSSWFALDRSERASVLSLIGCPALILGTSAPLPMRISTIRPLRHLIERLQPPSAKQVDRLAAMAGEDFSDLPELRDLFVAYEKLPDASHQILAMHRAALGLRGSWPEVQLNEPELARLTQPVQLIWGENDPFGSPAVGQQAAEIIPDADFHRVGGGHGPWFTQSDVVGPLVTNFLREHTTANSSNDESTPGGTR